MRIKTYIIYILLAALPHFQCFAKACPKPVFAYDTSFSPVFIEGQYLGIYRDIKNGKRIYIDIAKKSFPGYKYIFDLYRREIYFHTSFGENLWLPIQEQVFQVFTRYVKAKDQLKLYCRNLGSVGNETVVLIIDFERSPLDELY